MKFKNDIAESLPPELAEVIFSFKFGDNKILQLVEILNEISLMTGKPIDEPFKSPEWLEIYNNPKMPIFQKGLWMRQFLLSKRYPVYMELRNKIKKYINKISLPKNISIDDEILTLEKDSIDFKIVCKKQEDLKTAAQKMAEIADSQELKEILKILRP